MGQRKRETYIAEAFKEREKVFLKSLLTTAVMPKLSTGLFECVSASMLEYFIMTLLEHCPNMAHQVLHPAAVLSVWKCRIN